MSELLSKEVEAIAETISQTKHDECEDPWYSCPLAENGMPEVHGNECTCGMEAFNDRVRSALRSVLLLAAKRLCLDCLYGIPLTKDGHLLGGENRECSAAPRC